MQGNEDETDLSEFEKESPDVLEPDDWIEAVTVQNVTVQNNG